VVVALRPEAEALRSLALASGLRVGDIRRTVTWRRCVWHAHLHDTYDRELAALAITRSFIGPTVLTEHLPRTNASDRSLLPGPRRRFATEAKTIFKRTELSCANAVIALSPSSADFLAERYGLERDRTDVIMNGIQPSPTRVRHREPRETVHVVSVGSVIQQKGHDLLLDAARHSRGVWQAGVLGDGPWHQTLAGRAADDGLPVTFCGWADDVAGALLDADVACLPSRWESCPYAALEAMDAGLPLVGTDVDGLRELIEPDVTGLLVPPDDPRALAEALDLLAGDVGARRRMGEAARARASSFTLAGMAQRTAAVYGRIVDRRSPGTARAS
jgi:glycosyltransferase involved in cell wall biosynthesis